MKKIIVARLNVQEEKISQFLILAKTMIQESNLEVGCLTYSLFADVNIPSDFLFYEEYRNQQAVDDHNLSDHFNTFVHQVSTMLTKEPHIGVY